MATDGRLKSLHASTKDKANLYRRAARMAERNPSDSHDGCCDSLNFAGANYEDLAAFADIFRPTQEEQIAYLGEVRIVYWMGDPFTPENHEARVLALCFMAAMVEAGDA